MKARFVPLITDQKPRTAIGLVLALLAPVVAARLLDSQAPGLGTLAALIGLAWAPSVYLTDKYRHKYPQRYYSYLLASHLKAALIMGFALGVIDLLSGPGGSRVLWLGLALFILGDALVSLCRTRAPTPLVALGEPSPPGQEPAVASAPSEVGNSAIAGVDSAAILARIPASLEGHLTEFVRVHLPPGDGPVDSVVLIDDIPVPAATADAGAAGLLVGTIPLNQVKRLNLYLQHCVGRVAMGGYAVFTYTPLESVNAELRRRFPGVLFGPAYLLHFIWHRALPKLPWLDKLYFSPKLAWIDRMRLKATGGRTRVLSKAETWGRLAFYGMEVLAERDFGQSRIVIARRVAPPIANRKPSYYAIVALEKVGLDGEVIRLHKVRSMYPFSEFLQKAIFQSHGLSATGKFKDDFRLTEYGKLIRRHWIDELPGLYDWLRGDIKLVGMRATSPHFLSLYPRELYDIYIQVKPGLVPPIFDESTGGFDKIVETELTYLQRYLKAPVRTDILYFWYTFRDIFVRKVRSH